MAVVSLKTGTTNADGLRVYYGVDEATETRAGQHQLSDGKQMTEVIIALASLPTVASTDAQIVGDTTVIPDDAIIEKVEVFVLKETTGVNANLDLGLVSAVDRSTEIDFNGFLAAADAFNGGTDLGTTTEYVVGTTEAGALIGTRLTVPGLITCSAETADFTAGVIRVRVYWYIPLSGDL